jgi:plasmid stabilization system protein ParE
MRVWNGRKLKSSLTPGLEETDVVFRRIAKREFDEAISWYQDRREGLGREFSVAVEEQLGRIALSPTQFTCIRGEVRRAVLQRFPYYIYFIIEDNRILVLAIFTRGEPLRTSLPGFSCRRLAARGLQLAASRFDSSQGTFEKIQFKVLSANTRFSRATPCSSSSSRVCRGGPSFFFTTLSGSN